MLKKSIIALLGCLVWCGLNVAFAATNNKYETINLTTVGAHTNTAEIYFSRGTEVDVLGTDGKTRSLTIDKYSELAEGDVVTMISKGGMCVCVADGLAYKIATPSDGTIVVDKDHCTLILLNDKYRVSKILVLAGKPGVAYPFYRLGGNVTEIFFPHHHSP